MANAAADASAGSRVDDSGSPWVERYRPKNLQQVSHQAEVVATLQNAVSTGRLPHLLFYGPPGTGKTSVALALCRQLFDPSQRHRRVMELNASDERGIAVVRDKIKHFASLAVAKAPANKKSFFRPAGQPKDDDAMDTESDKPPPITYPNPPFKIIILDEADSVTPDAQAALRRIIEAHSHITRFILICNYVTRIIEPLASRCAKFRFQPLPPASMMARLQDIAKQENCHLPQSHLDFILHQARGDMRKAVTTLQSAHALEGPASTSRATTTLSQDDLAELAGQPPPRIVNELWDVLSAPKAVFGNIQTAVEHIIAEGFSTQALLMAFFDKILKDDKLLSELAKAQLSIRIAEAEKCLVSDGADEFLQLMNVCSLAFTLFKQCRDSKK